MLPMPAEVRTDYTYLSEEAMENVEFGWRHQSENNLPLNWLSVRSNFLFARYPARTTVNAGRLGSTTRVFPRAILPANWRCVRLGKGQS
jgi:hypothetical protein